MKTAIYLFAIYLLYTACSSNTKTKFVLSLYATCKSSSNKCKEFAMPNSKTINLDLESITPLSIETAIVQQSHGKKYLNIQLQKDSSQKLENITTKELNNKLAVAVGNKIIMAPKIQGTIKGGNFTLSTPTATIIDNICSQLKKRCQKQED